MSKVTTLKTISLVAAMAVTTAFSSTAFAHDTSKAVSDTKIQHHVTKKNARSLVNELLKREYKGQGFKAREISKVSGKWKVNIKYNLKQVATAYVDRTSGNIHIKSY